MKRHIWAAAAEAERSAANDHELRDMAVGKSIMKLTVRPLTPDLWPAVVDLFGDSRVCSRCWVHVLEDRRCLPRETGQDEQGDVSGGREAWSTPGPTRL